VGDGPCPAAAGLDRLVHHVASNWRVAPLRPGVLALLDFAERVTREPADLSRGAVEALRLAGWSDVAIHDAVQVIAYFNYINRVADALGVEPEPGGRGWGQAP
jgi:uncharacterized peroxidase-related enzyme